MTSTSEPTLCDVVENWRLANDIDPRRGFDDVSTALLVDVSDAIQRFIADCPVPRRRDNEIRLLPSTFPGGGMLGLRAAAIGLRDSDLEAKRDEAELRKHRQAYVASLLYADTTVEVENLFPLPRDRMPAAALEFVWRRCAIASIEAVEYLRPVIAAGILIIAPQLPSTDRAASWDAAVRDCQPFRATLGAAGSRFVPTEHENWVTVASDRSWLTPAHLGPVRHMVEVAERTDASLLPLVDWEWPYIAFMHDREMPRERPCRVATSLAEVELPMFAGLSPHRAVQVHRDEEAFDEWRAALRLAANLIAGARFADDATVLRHTQQVYEDVLLPRVNAVKRAVSRTAALRAAMSEQPVRATLGALISAGAYASLGLPATAAVVSAAAGATANIGYEALRKRGADGDGADAIISILLR